MPTDAEARAVLTQHEDALTRLPNVVGVGIVADAAAAARSVIAVYVGRKRARSALRPGDIVPPTLTSVIDGERSEIPTRVIEVGEIKF